MSTEAVAAPIALPSAVPPPAAQAGSEPTPATTGAPEIPADLVAAAAARDAKLARFAPKGTAPAAPAAEEEPAAGAAEQPAAQAATEGQAEGTQAPAAEAEAPKDALADRVAAYLQQDRRIKAEKTQLKAERAAIATEKAALEAAKAQAQKVADLQALAEKDPVAAVRSLLGPKVKGDFVVQLLNQMAAEEDGTAPTETDQQREERIAKQAEERALARIKAEREAEEKKISDARAKEEAEIAKKNAVGKEAFFWGLDAQLKAELDKYPYIAAQGGIDVAAADRWMQERFAQTQKIPSHTEIFTHFNSHYAAEAEKHLRTYLRVNGGKLPADAAPAPVAVKTPLSAVAPIARADTRGATTAPAVPAKGKRSYKQDVEEAARKLDEMDRARNSHNRG
jgi:hypothetical protein